MTDISSVTQNQIFPCEQCQRSFKKRSKLARHVRETHLNLKEFVCSVCNKSFKRNSHLKRHFVTHSTDPKPFKCLYADCLMRFSDKYHLERHIKVKHKNIKFECQACGLSFEKKLFLFKHNFQSHNTEKPFKCFHSNCLKSFYTKGSLAKHLKHHEFPFKRKKNSKKNEQPTETANETNINPNNIAETKEENDFSHLESNLKEMSIIFEKILDYHAGEIPGITLENKDSQKNNDLPSTNGFPVLKQEEQKKFEVINGEVFNENGKFEKINSNLVGKDTILNKQEDARYFFDEAQNNEDFKNGNNNAFNNPNVKIPNHNNNDLFEKEKEINVSKMDNHNNFLDQNALNNNYNSNDFKKENEGDRQIKDYIPKKRNRGSETQNNCFFVCNEPNCCKVYSTMHNLKTHIRTAHIKRRDFVCSFEDCNKAFLHKKSLKEHLLKCHGVIKPFV